MASDVAIFLGLASTGLMALSGVVLALINQRGQRVIMRAQAEAQLATIERQAQMQKDSQKVQVDGQVAIKELDDATAIRRELRDDVKALKLENAELRVELETCKTQHLEQQHINWQLSREINDLRERLGLAAQALAPQPPGLPETGA